MNKQISKIEAQLAHIETIREQMFDTEMIKLQTGLDGYDAPETHAIYKVGGGMPLGVVGGTKMNKFEPPKLKLLLDIITQAVMTCCPELDLTKLEFTEWNNGSRVALRLPVKNFQVKSKMEGDITKASLNIKTGFDGNTAYQMSIDFYRIWCSNGCGTWDKAQVIKFKNTTLNANKVPMLAGQIVERIAFIDDYKGQLDVLAKTKVTKKQVDKFILDNFGYDVALIDEMNKRSRDRMNAINEAVAIEMTNTGQNLFSLLQGMTRFTTHNRAESQADLLLNPSIETMEQKLQSSVMALANFN